ncbi:TQO small subunit DoxD [Sulfuracidifex tepidarius]|nr:TQO small subunit DoxD [Sulfuracidifex tepidarius]
MFRLIAGSIWIVAGVLDKLLNPGFLNPDSTKYVGFTIQYFAEGSPIKGFLYSVAFPNPVLTGELVIIGEISFGVLFMSGMLTKLASTCALYTNLIYFLSAAWTGATEYGINLLLMGVDLYFLVNGAKRLSIDSMAPESPLWSTKLWFTAGSVLYLLVVIFLYLKGL